MPTHQHTCAEPLVQDCFRLPALDARSPNERYSHEPAYVWSKALCLLSQTKKNTRSVYCQSGDRAPQLTSFVKIPNKIEIYFF
jgi:hypothetical protein